MKQRTPYFLLCLLLLALVVTTACLSLQTEMHAERWTNRVTSLGEVEQLNRELLQAFQYTQCSLDATRMLANENGILCEREAKVTLVLAGLEEENLTLKNSLNEAVGKLELQLSQINVLMDINDRLRYKIDCLETALEAIEDAEEEPAPAPQPEEKS